MINKEEKRPVQQSKCSITVHLITGRTAAITTLPLTGTEKVPGGFSVANLVLDIYTHLEKLLFALNLDHVEVPVCVVTSLEECKVCGLHLVTHLCGAVTPLLAEIVKIWVF